MRPLVGCQIITCQPYSNHKNICVTPKGLGGSVCVCVCEIKKSRKDHEPNKGQGTERVGWEKWALII